MAAPLPAAAAPAAHGRRSPSLVARFAPTIELVRTFDASLPPAEIQRLPTVPVADNLDLDCRSVSAALVAATAWSLESSSLPLHPSFDGRPVMLEAVAVDPPAMLGGTVLVRNIAYAKAVAVRLTADGWRTHTDVPCSFDGVVSQSTAGFVGVDRFRFELDLAALSPAVSPAVSAAAQQPAAVTLELAVRFDAAGASHWDSNGGRNFVVRVCTIAAFASSRSRVSSADSIANAIARPLPAAPERHGAVALACSPPLTAASALAAFEAPLAASACFA
ncbi:Protein phosphatase 1 regulatory subunit 3B [Polyrhizophydium stewartii]|uniref:Protein phosphatase 1 regulatory subunit 3B n=1 Tax=Polyrhizophydium stewartii TaxID=2732419 RepID=A0ABR4NF58_9FUNG